MLPSQPLDGVGEPEKQVARQKEVEAEVERDVATSFTLTRPPEASVNYEGELNWIIFFFFCGVESIFDPKGELTGSVCLEEEYSGEELATLPDASGRLDNEENEAEETMDDVDNLPESEVAEAGALPNRWVNSSMNR